MNFKGAYTAIITPFNDSGSVDEDTLAGLIEKQIDGGIAGLVPMGTTGESPTVSHEENIKVIELAVKITNGRVPVIAGTGSNSTVEAIDMTKKARDVGADASLQVCPYYNKPSQEGLFRHFSAIADSVNLPLIIYNIPGRTSRNIENATMLRLARHDNIQAVKEASGDLAQVMDLYRALPDDFTILSGDDNLAFPIIALGGKGVISVAANLLPGEMQQLVDSGVSGNVEEARSIHYRLLPFFKSLFFDTNPIPIKYALSRAGLCKENYRLPLCPMDDNKKKKVDAILETLGVLS
jgi:4-hydroxy-tetrahydrodipicolinate synthase